MRSLQQELALLGGLSFNSWRAMEAVRSWQQELALLGGLSSNRLEGYFGGCEGYRSWQQELALLELAAGARGLLVRASSSRRQSRRF